MSCAAQNNRSFETIRVSANENCAHRLFLPVVFGAVTIKSDERSNRYFGHILVTRSEIRVSEICIDPNS